MTHIDVANNENNPSRTGLLRSRTPQEQCSSRAGLLKSRAPQEQGSSRAGLLKSRTPQEQDSSRAGLLKSRTPQTRTGTLVNSPAFISIFVFLFFWSLPMFLSISFLEILFLCFSQYFCSERPKTKNPARERGSPILCFCPCQCF